MILRSASFSHLMFPLLLITPVALAGQVVQPFVEHWDAKKTIKKSEGLFVSGREWGEWSFYDPQGRLVERSEFKSGERDGHVILFHDNGQVKHDGWFKRGVEDSVRTSRYRDGDLMEQGSYAMGRKTGPWMYYFHDSLPMLREVWEDSLVLVTDAWDSTGVQTIAAGNGTLRAYYASGNLQEESTYAQGVKNGPSAVYYPAGNAQAKGRYRGGVKDGLWEYWYSNGEPEKKEGFVNGALEGPYQLWFRNGAVNVEGWHRGGQKDSLWTWYTTA
ncbi:MAG: hypothetical protein R2811_00005, partial [Flavobacteriales bacterium]